MPIVPSKLRTLTIENIEDCAPAISKAVVSIGENSPDTSVPIISIISVRSILFIGKFAFG